ncbi:MAG: exopolysaccharide biosynthesis polyprenyl glycosylphosphotransferase [Terracidiphilus sp.]|jgi:exopolysaccharide biosynthesis polyprenyl glycosylphosphotransferase
MSTQHSVPHPAKASSPPGIALVRRLDAPSRSKPARWERALLRVCLYPLPAFCGLLLEAILPLAGVPRSSPSTSEQFVLVLSFAWIAAIECFHATQCGKINREHTGAMAALVSATTASGTAALLLALLGLHFPSIFRCAIYAALLFFTSVIIKVSLRALFDTQSPLTRIVVVESHILADGEFWTLTHKEVSRHEISGAIRLESLERSHLANSAHSLDDLVREIRRGPAEEVLISAPLAQVAVLSQRIGSNGGVRASVRFIIDSKEGTPLRQSLSTTDRLYLLNIGAVPTKTLHYLILKKAFDLVFSLAAIIFGFPLFVLIALAIKIGSKGSIFFIQDRVGWNGRVFQMYKFRTMHTAPLSETDTRWSQPDDSRRTRVGKILRKYSLDELPQFLNVLKGDMSVVGPRPERPFFVDSFRREIDEYHRRHQIKVGITGWAQVNGLRGDTCIRTRLMYDLYYLQNWGLIFDLKIVLRTVLCVFRGRDAD